MSQSDDLISRRSVIDAMKDMYRAAEKWLRDATDDVTKARAESCMASLIEIKLRTEKLPVVQPEPHWIPCSEGLPKEKGTYLVTYHPCHWDYVEPVVEVGIDTFRGRSTWAKNKFQRVIAWMSMPISYCGGGNENE